MSKKIIVTGVNGFVGEHVVNTFIDEGYDVIGLGYDATAHKKISEKLFGYISCNLLDPSSLEKISLTDVAAIIHLAGLSNVSESFDKPLQYMNDNVVMAYNLLDHANKNDLRGRVLVISSGALYDPYQTLPLSEDSRTLENSPYAVGKLSVEHVTNYFRVRGFDAIVVRPFNHIGPGQGPGFLVPDLYAQLDETIQSGTSNILVGNLSTKRDYTDVRDITEAYKLLALAPTLKHGVYNVCTGRSLSGNEILEILQNELNVTNVSPIVDQSKVRPTDIADIYGDSSRLKNETGWEPKIDTAHTIHDFVEFQAK